MLVAALAYGLISASTLHRAEDLSLFQPETPFTIRTKRRTDTQVSGLRTGTV